MSFAVLSFNGRVLTVLVFQKVPVAGDVSETETRRERVRMEGKVAIFVEELKVWFDL